MNGRRIVWYSLFVFAAGYDTREAIESWSWRFGLMAVAILGLGVLHLTGRLK